MQIIKNKKMQKLIFTIVLLLLSFIVFSMVEKQTVVARPVDIFEKEFNNINIDTGKLSKLLKAKIKVQRAFNFYFIRGVFTFSRADYKSEYRSLKVYVDRNVVFDNNYGYLDPDGYNQVSEVVGGYWPSSPGISSIGFSYYVKTRRGKNESGGRINFPLPRSSLNPKIEGFLDEPINYLKEDSILRGIVSNSFNGFYKFTIKKDDETKEIHDELYHFGKNFESGTYQIQIEDKQFYKSPFYKVVLDKAPPKIKINNFSNNQQVFSSNVFTIIEENFDRAIVTIEKNGNIREYFTTEKYHKILNLEGGEIVSIKAFDKAGNTTNIKKIVYDINKPSIHATNSQVVGKKTYIKKFEFIKIKDDAGIKRISIFNINGELENEIKLNLGREYILKKHLNINEFKIIVEDISGKTIVQHFEIYSKVPKVIIKGSIKNKYTNSSFVISVEDQEKFAELSIKEISLNSAKTVKINQLPHTINKKRKTTKYIVMARDILSNESQEEIIILDTEKPKIDIKNMNGFKIENLNSLNSKITISVSDETDINNIYLTNLQNKSKKTIKEKSFDFDMEGDFELMAVDLAGNTNTQIFNIDYTNPVAKLLVNGKKAIDIKDNKIYSNKNIRLLFFDNRLIKSIKINGQEQLHKPVDRKEIEIEFKNNSTINLEVIDIAKNKQIYHIYFLKDELYMNYKRIVSQGNYKYYYSIENEKKRYLFKELKDLRNWVRLEINKKMIVENDGSYTIYDLNGYESKTKDKLQKNLLIDEIVKKIKITILKSAEKTEKDILIENNQIINKEFSDSPVQLINEQEVFWIDKEFTFLEREKNTTEIYITKIDNQGLALSSEIQLSYSTSLESMLSSHIEDIGGIYKITERDIYGNSISYFIYIDNETPKFTIFINGSKKGVDVNKSVENAIENKYEKLVINNISDKSGNNRISIEVNGKDSTLEYANKKQIEFSNIATKSGINIIKIRDLQGNSIIYSFYIAGKGVEIKNTIENKNLKFEVILDGVENSIKKLEIFKKNYYGEWEKQQYDSLGKIISKSILKYGFEDKGDYKIKIKDFYNREKEFEYSDFKTAYKVSKSNRNNDSESSEDIIIQYPLDYSSEITAFDEVENRISTFNYTKEEITNGNKLLINSPDNQKIAYKIIIYKSENKTVFDEYNMIVNKRMKNFNIYEITQEGPVIFNGDITKNNIVVDSEYDIDINDNYLGGKYTYKKGEEIKLEGIHELSVVDENLNIRKLKIQIDKQIDYSVQGAKKYHQVYYSNAAVKIKSEETLKKVIVFQKNNKIKELELVKNIDLEYFGIFEVEIEDIPGNRIKIVFDVVRKNDLIKLKEKEKKEYNHAVLLTISEQFAGFKIYKDKEIINRSSDNLLFEDEGNYIIKVEDLYGNKEDYSFKIDKSVLYKSNIKNNQITTSSVTISPIEEIKILISETKGIISDKTFSKIGQYNLILKDKLGNESKFSFKIIPKISRYQKFNKKEHFIKSVKKDGKEYKGDFFDYTKSGKYILDIQNQEEIYQLEFEIYNEPPSLSISKLRDGSILLNNISKGTKIRFYHNGKEKSDFNKSNKITEKGEYKISLEDALGNSKTYAFNIKRKLNIYTYLLMGLVGFLILAVIIVIVKNKKRRRNKRK